MSEAKTEKTGVKGKKVLVAVILVRGLIDIKEGIKDTLKMLRLFRKNYCVVIEDSASSRGM